MGSSLTGVKTEMPFSFSVSGTSDEKDVLSSWGKLSQLIESQTLTLGGKDSLSGLVGESKSADSKSLWDVEESSVVSYRSDDGEDS